MPNGQDFKIKTEAFEGPLDLLLSLIEKRKLLINDIALAQVTDDYISHVKEMGNFSINKTSHFILIASTLLLIKSKSLLPSMNLSDEEQQDINDLESRLKLYKIYKDASVNIQSRFAKNVMHNKLEIKNSKLETIFAPSKQITLENIYASAMNVIKSLPKIEKVPEAVIKKVISLEEMIGRLTDRIQNSLKMSFKEFSNHSKAEKVDVIVSFLAMLELVRQDVLKVEQSEKYSDIQMETNKISTPKYS